MFLWGGLYWPYIEEKERDQEENWGMTSHYSVFILYFGTLWNIKTDIEVIVILQPSRCLSINYSILYFLKCASDFSPLPAYEEKSEWPHSLDPILNIYLEIWNGESWLLSRPLAYKHAAISISILHFDPGCILGAGVAADGFKLIVWNTKSRRSLCMWIDTRPPLSSVSITP